MKKILSKFIPRIFVPLLEKIYYFPLDVIDRLKGRDSMTPPRSMIFVGAGDFAKIGDEFKTYFVELGKLHPDDRVLDVGCGIGRMAVPLTKYLSRKGEYQGFDIVKKGIDWCNSHISSQFDNFHFMHSDIYNKHYNPKGRQHAGDYKFPFQDEYFDFVFLTSVFTHMLPRDLENYLREISRVLKTGGNCLITFFLLNEESRSFIRAGNSYHDFKYEVEGCLTTDKNYPEVAIAYDEDSVKNLFNKYGLEIVPPIHYGSWCNREAFLSHQDLIISFKKQV